MNASDRNTSPQDPASYPHVVTPTFCTLDLTRALSTGWDDSVGISRHEVRVLLFIAQWGKRNEPGVAFAWFARTQAAWAERMHMSHDALRKNLERLRRKGLVVDIPGSIRDARYRHVRGYGIPVSVMADALEYVTGGHTECPKGVTGGHIDVTGGYTESPTALTGVGLSVPNPVLTPDERTTPPLTGACSPAGCSPPDPQGPPMPHQEDSWSAPSDADRDEWSTPKDYRDRKKYKRPTTVVVDHFWDCWVKARVKRVNLAYPWGVKAIPMKNTKVMLEEHDLDEVLAMVDRFFVLVDINGIRLTQDELWKDFWFQRAQLYKLVRRSRRSSGIDIAAHNRKHGGKHDS